MVDRFTLDLRTQTSIRLKAELQSELNTYWKVPLWPWSQFQKYILVDHFLLLQMDWENLES